MANFQQFTTGEVQVQDIISAYPYVPVEGITEAYNVQRTS
jgi:hypothetical protein